MRKPLQGGPVFNSAFRIPHSAIPGVAFLGGITRPGFEGVLSARADDAGTPGDVLVVHEPGTPFNENDPAMHRIAGSRRGVPQTPRLWLRLVYFHKTAIP